MTPENAPALALRTGRRGIAAVAGAAAVTAAPGAEAPPLRPGLIPRPRLLRRLAAAEHVPIALVVAPAGYGKTTLLAEWAARDRREFAWVSLRAAAGEEEPPLAFAGRVLEEASDPATPRVVVVDDAHLAAPGSLGRIRELACRLPAGSMLALASRRRLAMPVARLRADRLVVEIGARELTMTRLEAAMLLDAAGFRLDGEQVDRLLERTEGWPAGLYLAALSLGEQPRVEDAIARFAGSDRLVADYIRSEVLADLPAEQIAFLRRTSILDRLTGPLCDAVLDADASALVLEELARDSVPIDPLDRANSAFRYQRLLAEMLHAELTRTEPELEAALHRRSADWHGRHGEVGIAIRHALAAHDGGRAGRLLWSVAPAHAARGGAPAIGGWLEGFAHKELAVHPELALAAATYHLAEGRRDEAERSAQAAALALDGNTDASGLRAAVVMVRACVARHGVRRMGEDAALACALASPDSAWQSLGHLIAGVARHLTGDRATARPLLEDGARRAATDAPIVEALCHAQLALLAVELEDWEDAARRVRDAQAALRPVPPGAPACALVLAVCGAVEAHRGDVAEARRHAAAGGRLLASLAGFTPWYVAEAQIWLARAEMRLSDAAAARTLLACAARTLGQVQDAPVLAGWLHEGWERADAFAAGSTGTGPALTNAELRVLRFLPSHLSFREIGARLHVSSNTVKTQALSVYRKLEVSCRSDAVSRGRSVGLIDG